MFDALYMFANIHSSIPHITCIHCGKRSGRSITADTTEPPWQLLRENFVPSPEDEIHTRSLIADAKLEMEAIDRDITQLQAVIDQLKAKRACVDAYTRGQEGIGAPIRRLPKEILCKIFTICSSEEIVPNKKDGTTSRWQIIRVNFHWRQLARSLKELWASISVKFRTGWKLPYGRTAFCVRNSGTSPMNLLLENMSNDGFQLPSDFPTPVLPEHSSIRALTVKGCVLTSISQYQDSFRNLKSLDVLVTDDHAYVIEQIFLIAPGLTRVSLKASERLLLKNLLIPWHQITCLILNVRIVLSANVSGGDTLKLLLTKMPHLVELGLVSISTPLANNQSLILPNVRTFHFFSQANDYTILQVLILPALAHFNVKVGAHFEACFRSMTSMIERSACQLESLLIVDHNIPQLPLLFPHIPTLKELDIRLTRDVQDDIFTMLKWAPHSDANTQFLPCLESIKIRFSHSHRIDCNTWAEIVNSRCAVTPCSPQCQACIFPARLRQLQLVSSRSHLESLSIDVLAKAANDHRIQLFLSLYRGNEVNSKKYFETEIARL